MIDRINGRLALLLAVAGLLIVLLAGWFVLVSPQRSKAAALDTQIGDASLKLAATQAFLRSPAAHQSVADLRAPARRAPRRREDVRDPAAARVGIARERRQHHQHHAVRSRCVDRGAGGADRAHRHRPLLPDREVHAPAPDARRGEGRKGARVGAAVRHRQHLVLERRQGPDHGDARARRVRRTDAAPRAGDRRPTRRRRPRRRPRRSSGLGGGNQAPDSRRTPRGSLRSSAVR